MNRRASSGTQIVVICLQPPRLPSRVAARRWPAAALRLRTGTVRDRVAPPVPPLSQPPTKLIPSGPTAAACSTEKFAPDRWPFPGVLDGRSAAWTAPVVSTEYVGRQLLPSALPTQAKMSGRSVDTQGRKAENFTPIRTNACSLSQVAVMSECRLGPVTVLSWSGHSVDVVRSQSQCCRGPVTVTMLPSSGQSQCCRGPVTMLPWSGHSHSVAVVRSQCCRDPVTMLPWSGHSHSVAVVRSQCCRGPVTVTVLPWSGHNVAVVRSQSQCCHGSVTVTVLPWSGHNVAVVRSQCCRGPATVTVLPWSGHSVAVVRSQSQCCRVAQQQRGGSMSVTEIRRAHVRSRPSVWRSAIVCIDCVQMQFRIKPITVYRAVIVTHRFPVLQIRS